MNRIQYFLPLLLLVLSCKTIEIEAPDVVIEDKLELPEQRLSSISIPVKVNLKPYYTQTEKSVSKEFKGNEQMCEGVSYSYKFVREPIEFVGKGEHIQFGVDGKYALNLNYCPQCTDLFTSKAICVVPRIYASCGVDEPMRKIRVSYTSEIGLNRIYQLTSKTKLKEVKAITPCKITVFDYNATEKLEEELSGALKAVEKDIDKEIGSIDLHPEMEKIWNSLSSETNLNGYGFLYLNPRNISLSDIRYKGDTAYFNTVLSAKPLITLHHKDILETRALPNLSNHEPKEGFDITMDISATYDSLGALLTREINGTKMDFKGKEIIFGEIGIYGASGNQLTISVEFSGKKKGTLYLVGTPVFDAENQFISFPDIAFDIKTRSALLKSAKWLFDKRITEKIRLASALDLKPYLNSFKKTLSENLNGELTTGVFMTGKVKEIKIDTILPREDELFMRVSTTGTLKIAL